MATRIVSEDSTWFHLEMCPSDEKCPGVVPGVHEHFARSWTKAVAVAVRGKKVIYRQLSLTDIVREFDLLWNEAQTEERVEVPGYSGVRV